MTQIPWEDKLFPTQKLEIITNTFFNIINNCVQKLSKQIKSKKKNVIGNNGNVALVFQTEKISIDKQMYLFFYLIIWARKHENL